MRGALTFLVHLRACGTSAHPSPRPLSLKGRGGLLWRVLVPCRNAAPVTEGGRIGAPGVNTHPVIPDLIRDPVTGRACASFLTPPHVGYPGLRQGRHAADEVPQRAS